MKFLDCAVWAFSYFLLNNFVDIKWKNKINPNRFIFLMTTGSVDQKLLNIKKLNILNNFTGL